MNSIKTVIIDDERLARQELKTLTAKCDQIQIIAEAENAFEAKEMINIHQPDLIFLDIQMPQKNGFELLEELDDRHLRNVIISGYSKNSEGSCLLCGEI